MLNKYMIIGNLGQDPELRYTEGGNPVCTLNIATNRVWSDKDGNKKEDVTWHRVVVWGKQAEACKEFLAKGRQVFVEGRFQSREYEVEGQKRYSAECVAHSVRFLGGKGTGGGAPTPPPPSDKDMSDEIPF